MNPFKNLFKRSPKLTHYLVEDSSYSDEHTFYYVYHIPNARLGQPKRLIYLTTIKQDALNYMEDIRTGVRDSYGYKIKIIDEVIV